MDLEGIIAILVWSPLGFLVGWGIYKRLRAHGEVARYRAQLQRIQQELRELRRQIELLQPLSRREQEAIHQQAVPEGLVTIMFSDLENFTAYAEQGDEVAYAVVQEHNRIMRACVGRFGGSEVKSYGDGFMMAFPSAKKALLCALEIQRAFEAHDQAHPDRPIRVRLGLNAGEPIKEGQDFIGRTVNLAARVADQARGGQVLVTETVKQLAGPIQGLQYIDRGLFQPQGFEEKHRLYEVAPVEALAYPLDSELDRKLEKLKQRSSNAFEKDWIDRS